MIKQSELQVRDVVKLSESPFSYAVVTCVTDDTVELFRPYATTDEILMAGNRVIPYIGIEQFSIMRTDREIELLSRSPCR